MTIAIDSMTPVTLPRFAPSSKSSSALQSGELNTLWGDSGDGFDFDILAEYLLDDGMPQVEGGESLGLSAFDFNLEYSPQSGVVSPEQQSEEGSFEVASMMPPKYDTTVQHVQNIITAHAAAAQQPDRQTLAPAPAPRAPHPYVRKFAQPGLPMAPAPVAPAALSNLSFPGPTPIPGAPPVVLHQHGAAAAAAMAANKRRRMDAPMMAVAGMPGVMNGQFVSQLAPGRGRQKSQAQIDRRRERNRILARRTRLRKKFFFESLQKDVLEMQRENFALKEIVKSKLDDETAKKLLDECNAMEKLPDNVLEAIGENMDMDRQDYSLVKSIQGSQRSFIITDPSLQDNPIVYASESFLELTGYSRDEVLGRNCRFLQGTETSAEKVAQVRKAIANGEDCSVTIINYTADGTAFWNKLFIAALRDAQNNIVNFIGVVIKVAAPDADDSEAGKLLPGQEVDGDAESAVADYAVKAMEGALSQSVANAAGVPGPFFS